VEEVGSLLVLTRVHLVVEAVVVVAVVGVDMFWGYS